MTSPRAGLAAVFLLVLTGCFPVVDDSRADGSSAENSGGVATTEEPPVTGLRLEAIDGDSLRDEAGNDYRLIGINAPDRDECLYGEASRRLDDLSRGEVYTETDSETFDQFGRRLVYLYAPGAEQALINITLVSEGLALAIHSPPNSTMTLALFEAQERARTEGVGLWDPDECGQGPLAPLRVADVNANPAGPDEDNLDDEYVVIENAGDTAINLTGFTIRDESTRNRYRFPDGFQLEAGDSVRVTSGEGSFGFGTGSPIWNNSGDTVLVVDDQGRFVAFSAVTAR